MNKQEFVTFCVTTGCTNAYIAKFYVNTYKKSTYTDEDVYTAYRLYSKDVFGFYMDDDFWIGPGEYDEANVESY